LSDVFDEMVERLKQKAKSGFEVVDKSEALGNVPATVCDVAYVCHECTDKDVCPFITEKQWVRLEDVLKLLEQIKQNYVLISEKELKKKLAEIKFYGTKVNGQLSDKPEYSPRYLADFIEKELLKEC